LIVVKTAPASGSFVRELRIEAKAEAFEEVHGFAEILDGQINEYLGSHFLCALSSVRFCLLNWV
jgi:hypothetical protein